MGLLNIGKLFITLAVLFNSIEQSSQAKQFLPPPYGDLRPPSYEIINGAVRLTGESIGTEAVVMDGYFLGTWEHDRFRPVDPVDDLSIILLRTGRFVRVSDDFRSNLITRQALQSGRLNLARIRAEGRPVGHDGFGRGGAGHDGAGHSGVGR